MNASSATGAGFRAAGSGLSTEQAATLSLLYRVALVDRNVPDSPARMDLVL
jgi:hypothetical protein